MYLFYCHVIVRGHNENKRLNLLEEDPGIVFLSTCRNDPFLLLVLLLLFSFFFFFFLLSPEQWLEFGGEAFLDGNIRAFYS